MINAYVIVINEMQDDPSLFPLTANNLIRYNFSATVTSLHEGNHDLYTAKATPT